jgi:hypothetical protein
MCHHNRDGETSFEEGDTNESMPLPIKHRVTESDDTVLIEEDDTIHIHSDTETVMWSRS